eukprot:COSAG06_NODE_36_length_30622_cov_18.404869_14_plen_183_part_00
MVVKHRQRDVALTLCTPSHCMSVTGNSHSLPICRAALVSVNWLAGWLAGWLAWFGRELGGVWPTQCWSCAKALYVTLLPFGAATSCGCLSLTGHSLPDTYVKRGLISVWAAALCLSDSDSSGCHADAGSSSDVLRLSLPDSDCEACSRFAVKTSTHTRAIMTTLMIAEPGAPHNTYQEMLSL